MTPTNYVANVRRANVTPLYDTYTQAAGNTPTPIVMFSTLSANRGIQLTNLSRANELQFPQKFWLTAVRWVPIGMGLADIVGFYKNYALRLIRGTAVELEAPVEYFAGGAGVQGGVSTGTGTAADVSFYNNGVPDPRAIAGLGEFRIPLEAGDHFEINLVGTTFAAAAAVFFRVYFDGIWEKGVM